MKYLLILVLLASNHLLASQEALYQAVQKEFPEAVEIREIIHAREIGNSTKRQSKTVKEASINRDKLFIKMIERIQLQQMEIDNLKKTVLKN